MFNNTDSQTSETILEVVEQGRQGIQGEVGEGFPSGGTSGQILVKQSDEDYDADWENPTEEPEEDFSITVDGTTGEILYKDPSSSYTGTFTISGMAVGQWFNFCRWY